MRRKIYEIIEKGREDDYASRLYDLFIMVTIVASIIPLTFKNDYTAFKIIDRITTVIYIVDYILRLATADLKINKGIKSFFIYPFTAMAIVDLVSILPSVSILISKELRLFKVFRLLKTFRIFKAFRYSKNINLIVKVFKKQKDSLIVVCWLAIGYVLITALIIFNVEPDTFNNSFFDAVYWSTVSLTTVGYGDIYAVSDVGKIITMVSSLFGIAIVALPSGIITAGYMTEFENERNQKKNSD